MALLMTILLAWQLPYSGQIQLEPGDVAPYNVVSPSRIVYESEYLTAQARARAEASIADQYDASQGRIRRQQVDTARKVVEFVTLVRNDPYATPQLQTDYLMAIKDAELTPDAITRLLSLGDQPWALVAQEVPLALDRAMREEIRESTLVSARNRVPSIIDTSLNEESSAVAADLVSALLRPNSIYNPERTLQLRTAAADAVPPQTETIEAEEIIIRAGDKADELAVEALKQLGLLQDQWDWWRALRSALFTLTLFATAIGLLYRLRPGTLTNVKEQLLISALMALWLLVAKFVIINHEWLPYLYPLAAFSMLITVLLDLRVGAVVTLVMMLFVHYLSDNSPILIGYLGLGALLGSIVLGRAERLTAFLWSGLAIALSNLLVMTAYYAPYQTFSPRAVLQLQLLAMLNGGLAASIALIGYFIIGNVFGITTSLQLTELSRPTHPLLRQLLLMSPGTYHHTIVVSNLAERAAAAIGADAFLTRVGAYYHDIGKTVRPYFFTENIVDGVSPHDKLDPHTSAQIIISHVTDGLDLAEKYHLPPRIRDFIGEHHGTSLVRYFYVKAQQAADEGEEVNEADFRYPGPNPRSKETAILLLADTCEAAVRAIRPANREELQKLINKLIDDRAADGELDSCDLTFSDLQTIKEVFLRVLEGVNHPRISYPESVQKKQAPASDEEKAVNASPGNNGDSGLSDLPADNESDEANPEEKNGAPKQAAAPGAEIYEVAEDEWSSTPINT